MVHNRILHVQFVIWIMSSSQDGRADWTKKTNKHKEFCTCQKVNISPWSSPLPLPTIAHAPKEEKNIYDRKWFEKIKQLWIGDLVLWVASERREWTRARERRKKESTSQHKNVSWTSHCYRCRFSTWQNLPKYYKGRQCACGHAEKERERKRKATPAKSEIQKYQQHQPTTVY